MSEIHAGVHHASTMGLQALIALGLGAHNASTMPSKEKPRTWQGMVSVVVWWKRRIVVGKPANNMYGQRFAAFGCWGW